MVQETKHCNARLTHNSLFNMIAGSFVELLSLNSSSALEITQFSQLSWPNSHAFAHVLHVSRFKLGYYIYLVKEHSGCKKPEIVTLISSQRDTISGFYWCNDNGGAMRDRTADLLRARQALSQLSYSPFLSKVFRGYSKMVGLGRLELPTSPLSGVRSNQLSYRPIIFRPDRPALSLLLPVKSSNLCEH